MEALVASHNVTLDQDGQLSVSPADTQGLLRTFNTFLYPYFGMVPEAVMEKYTASLAIIPVTDMATSDRDLRNPNAGKRQPRHSAGIKTRDLTQPLGEVGVTQLQDLLVELAKAQIRAGERNGLYRLVDSLSDQRSRGHDHYLALRSNCIPLVELIEGNMAAPGHRVPYHENIDDLRSATSKRGVSKMPSDCIRIGGLV
ncbi:hypothetical protein MAPG_11702 [Magnaporthiopsis poae ATCC 64411]|uniref:Uncharacterized protein n=1 Tax=Magnaporthiopsis poae (strain ATCC 64411 / 73-15) TaxID=644358 RepID=A0A0C4EFZ0_MAGP6|nr:hypothetical protein MAPG_11702 [Magnaporthiopsis poae ATCC 64411]